MSTRANIKIVDGDSTLWFYRHSDGYPEGALPTLKKFMSWVQEGKIRSNAGQASGWLILIGASEYDEYYENGKYYKKESLLFPHDVGYTTWKCGTYEPTTGKHGDIEYLYTLDLDKKTIEVLDIYDDTTETITKFKEV